MGQGIVDSVQSTRASNPGIGPVRKRQKVKAGAALGNAAVHIGLVPGFSIARRWFSILRRYILASRRSLRHASVPLRLAATLDATRLKQDTLMGVLGAEIQGTFSTVVMPPQVLPSVVRLHYAGVSGL